MSKNVSLKKISSNYILKKLLEYIKDEVFKFKMFIYSKDFQKKLGINQLDYLEKYLVK